MGERAKHAVDLEELRTDLEELRTARRAKFAGGTEESKAH